MDLDRLQASRMLSPQLETAFDTIIDAFLFLYKNGDGKLNKEELILALSEASPWERSPSHIAMTKFKEMDWDKNGEISLKKFLFALTKWVGMDSDDEEIPIAWRTLYWMDAHCISLKIFLSGALQGLEYGWKWMVSTWYFNFRGEYDG
ncbi:putative calcium-binding protein CML22 [Acorus calamus]|uniref:Calcium-binding protein CML22 n=1 Tax=Acorus calamus TaxID=4465 RepID=A0AAV9D271_ACOCL|nr:putative calcium-binding protein CML22 [Acorus calamus]